MSFSQKAGVMDEHGIVVNKDAQNILLCQFAMNSNVSVQKKYCLRKTFNVRWKSC